MREHVARIAWVSALQTYQVVCTECSEVLVEDIEQIGDFRFLYPGECEPGEILGVHVSDNVESGDYFGGVG